MRWLSLALGLLLLASAAPAATLQARLIRASNEGESADERLKDLQPKLKKVFGYEHYKLIGNKEALLKEAAAVRMDLGEGFVLFVKPRSVQKKTSELDVEWYSGKAPISKQSLKLAGRGSVFIKGPGVGRDWIILALTLRE